jgi:hypothetical protein
VFEVARKDWGYDALGNPIKQISKPKIAMLNPSTGCS